MNELAKIVLKSGKDQSVKRFHPWIFSGAIKKTYGNFQEGDVVDVYDNKDEFLAKGHYQIGSIAVRVLSFNRDTDIDYSFYKEKIGRAYQVRQLILNNTPDTNVYRLVHGEGDQLPGLIIDIYNTAVVVQMHSVGMFYTAILLQNRLRRFLRGN
jgi:23S rRNA (cytosine1962-C5)-methyltransferase